MIGILAGMGPMSTAPFIDKLMKAWQKRFHAHNDIDFPHVLIYSLPTPFYIDRPVDHARMQQTILDGLLKLESLGATLIAMPCNTAHRYFKLFQTTIKTPLLNMIDETLKRSTALKIGLLATEITVDSRLFQNALNTQGKTLVYEKTQQSCVNALIQGVKSNKPY